MTDVVSAPDTDRRLIVWTFCVILVAGFGALLFGLWEPKVDNARVFEIVSEDFKLMLVALTSFLGGRAISSPQVK